MRRKLSPHQVLEQMSALRLFLRMGKMPERRRILHLAGPQLIEAASSCVRNILNGVIKVKSPRMRRVIFGPRKKEFERFASLKTPVAVKRRMLMSQRQKGGFLGLLASVLAPLIGTAVSGIAKLINK